MTGEINRGWRCELHRQGWCLGPPSSGRVLHGLGSTSSGPAGRRAVRRPSGLRVPSRLWWACRPHRPGPLPSRKDSRARWSCLLSNDDGPILHRQPVVCLGSGGALASCGRAAVFIRVLRLKPLQSRSAGPAGWFLPVAGSVSFPPLFSAPQSTLNDIEQLRQASTGSTGTLRRSAHWHSRVEAEQLELRRPRTCRIPPARCRICDCSLAVP